jgi:hypothetical protein
VEEGVVSNEVPGQIHGVAIPQRFGLLLEMDPAPVISKNLAVRISVSGTDDQADFLGSRLDSLVQENGEHASRGARPINDSLKGEPALVRPRQCEDGLADFHGSVYRSLADLCPARQIRKIHRL